MVVIHKKKILKVGLLGNPNTGKTTLFNRLTGSAQYVGNWPGVTVEKKEGFVKNTSIPIKLTDLPGVYSLSPFSPEEVITRNYILDGNSDLIINILDATNLERNLYLTTQILELGNQVIIALNMSDMIERTGKIIDFCEMEKILGIPVIPISASKNIGINELVEKILKFEENKISNILKYDDEIENKLSKINKILKKNKNKITDNRFVLVKILEFDPIIISSLKLDFKSIEEIDKIRGPRKEIKYEEMITEARYNKSRFICQKVVSEISKIKKAKISRRIDKVVTGRYSAIPIFFVIILSVFHLSFGPIGSSFQKFTKLIIERGIASPVKILLTQISVNKIIESFIGAMISGLGEVISFMPQILLLLGLLSLLDDSGYMARAAFVMDRIMRKIGLSGKAFVPLLMGFGCSVPAILSTRILKSRREKTMAIFLIPFMSCGAKIPVYLVFLSAFFPENKTFMIFLIYTLGIIFAIITSFFFKNIIKSKESSFIMELPDYNWPSIQNLYLHVWDQTKDFLENAGTVIFGSAIVVWFMQSFDTNLRFISESSESLLAYLGNLISPIFNAAGFGDWRASISLLTGMISKEAIISTMAIVYGHETDLRDILILNFSKLSAFSIVIFILLYSPCIAAISTIKKELGTKIAIASFIYQTVLALTISTLIFQIGSYYVKTLA